MDIFSAAAAAIFIISYILISLEHKTGLSKSGIALFSAGLMWVLVAISGISPQNLSHALEAAGGEIFSIVIFLLAAMALVEVLVHYNFFDYIRVQLWKLHLDDKRQFLIIGIVTFFLSAVLDNLTTTIVMIQIARRFFKGENLLTAIAAIVILANAGGAWSPLGDVTTIMIWLAGKFTIPQIIGYGILPCLTLATTVILLMQKRISSDTADEAEEENISFSKSEKRVIAAALASFSFPLLMSLLGLQPYLGLLFGLGITWILIEYAKTRSHVNTHLEADLNAILQKADIASLKFFIGILLSVSALNSLGVLEQASTALFGAEQQTNQVIAGNVLMGMFSAIIDNVPLTAIALEIIHSTDPRIWVLLAITAGTGGSLLVIGSVAGIVALGMTKELNFVKYAKIAFVPALLGYAGAIAIWYLQYLLV